MESLCFWLCLKISLKEIKSNFPLDSSLCQAQDRSCSGTVKELYTNLNKKTRDKKLNQKLYEQLEQAISKDRLEEYSKILKTNKTKTIFTYYILNSEISKSLYIPLQNLEVALRNSIHTALSTHFKTEKWYEIDGFLEQKELYKINEAKNKLSKSRDKITPYKIISELSFGFWTMLFGRNYEQKIWNKLIKQIFPHIPKHMRNRKDIAAQINAVRYLRNKVFH